MFVAGTLLYQSTQIKNWYVLSYVWRTYLISIGVMGNAAGGCYAQA